jgi:prepilin-type N-terminal cleavage/methylation domain-containing protein
MFRKNKNHLLFGKGFSLVEIIIVIALMAVMTAVLFASQVGDKTQEDVATSARQVAAQLRALQNEALNGKQIGEISACYFKFETAGNETGYTISYNDCSNSLIDGSSQWIELGSGRQNVFISSAVNMYFSAPWGQVSTASSLIILTSKNDSSKQASVCVCNSGNIFDQKDVSACNC